MRAHGMPGAAADDLGGIAGVELTDGQIVQEEERRRAADQDVVHTVVHEIATDASVALQFGGNEHFRADAVGRGDERARGVARQAKEPGEAAQASS